MLRYIANRHCNFGNTHSSRRRPPTRVDMLGTPAAAQSFGKRHVLALWLFSGFVNVYVLRVSINVAIVYMANDTKAPQTASAVTSDTCPYLKDGNTTAVPFKEGEFNWNHATQGIVLSSFYYGYICTQIVGGYLARVVGARLLFGIGVGGTALLTVFNPMAARISPHLLVAVRVVEGLFEGVTFPSAHFLLGNWAPKSERSLLVSFPLSGPHIGTVLAAPLTGLLCDYGFAGGWPSSFYVFGALGVLWCFGWFIAVRDTPSKHPTISPEERAYLREQCQSSAKPISFMDVPWRRIITSPPVWAIVLAHTLFNWNFYTLLTEIPTYLKDVQHVRPSLNGVISSIPYVCLWLLQVLAAYIADVMRARGFKTGTVRKLSFFVGMIISALCLTAITYAGCNITMVIVLLCLAVGFSGFGQSGFIVNHVDIAPQYASILMGISNTFATLPGILSPLLTGIIINTQSTTYTWKIVFLLSAAISTVGSILFGVLADGEVQPWALVSTGEAADSLINESEDDVDDQDLSPRSDYGAAI